MLQFKHCFHSSRDIFSGFLEKCSDSIRLIQLSKIVQDESWGLPTDFKKITWGLKYGDMIGYITKNHWDYPLVNCCITMERSTIFSMGKSTISTGPCSRSQTVVFLRVLGKYYGDFTCDCFNCFLKKNCWAMLGCLPWKWPSLSSAWRASWIVSY